MNYFHLILPHQTAMNDNFTKKPNWQFLFLYLLNHSNHIRGGLIEPINFCSNISWLSLFPLLYFVHLLIWWTMQWLVWRRAPVSSAFKLTVLLLLRRSIICARSSFSWCLEWFVQCKVCMRYTHFSQTKSSAKNNNNKSGCSLRHWESETALFALTLCALLYNHDQVTSEAQVVCLEEITIQLASRSTPLQTNCQQK